ncbi:unnamed protein product, partial [Rhizoctonia solani]
QENISLPLPLDYEFPKLNSSNATEATNKGWQDSADQYAVVGRQANSEQVATLPPAPSISSEATREVESSLLRIDSYSSQRPQKNWFNASDVPEPEHDEEPTRNTFHRSPSPATANSYGPYTTGPAAESAVTSTQPYANIL